ncbi:hypothetical protein FF1_006749 [Malus domestica]
MALVPSSSALNHTPLIAEVDMGADYSGSTVRATVFQASTVFYDTPAALGPLSLAPPPTLFIYFIFLLTVCVYVAFPNSIQSF